jgi:hypothetical protein
MREALYGDREILFDPTCFCMGFKFPPLGLKGGILPLTADGITNPGRVFDAPGGVGVVLIFWGCESPSDTLRDRDTFFFSLFCNTGCTLRLVWRPLLG